MRFLIIDDDSSFLNATVLLIQDQGHLADGVETKAAALLRLQDRIYDAVLVDLRLGGESGLDLLTEFQRLQPSLPVIVISAMGNVKAAVEAMRGGACDFVEKPFLIPQLHAVLARISHAQSLARRINLLEQEVKDSRAAQVEPIFDFTAPAMKEAMDVLLRAAKTPASILILGESGTGKSVAAEWVHRTSHLADRPFLTISCPTLSKELLESELFGYVKGAYTGAIKDHWGKVKAADGGTLFLDEIGDLPQEIQPKLLRLLQERAYERVGENVTHRAEVRIIAATNRDLKQRVSTGLFREDLYFRLNVISVTMPPLRERVSDLLRFANHYLRHFAKQCSRNIEGFSEEAIARLCSYPWPGNLRELRNTIERAVILGRGEWVGPEDLPTEVLSTEPAPMPSAMANDGASEATPTPASLRALEELHIRQVLATAGTLAKASRILGIDQATLYRKRKKLGLS